MFKTSLSTTIRLLLLLLLWHASPVLAQAPFQQRVTGTCAGSSAIRQINADGTVVCEANVTSVGTGSGLTGGPITSSGTISVDSTQVQLRVTGTCEGGSAIRVVDQSEIGRAHV